MSKSRLVAASMVHCRTGSLETVVPSELVANSVHCRTGSLENLHALEITIDVVHCRTGSLEIYLLEPA